MNCSGCTNESTSKKPIEGVTWSDMPTSKGDCHESR